MDAKLGFSMLIVTALTVIFVGITQGSVRSLVKQFESGTYPETNATITRLDVVNAASGGTRNYTVKSLVLAYSYNVGDVQYTGTSYSFYDVANDPKHLTHLASEYNVGDVVPVYYDPSNPKEATVLKGVSALFSGSVLLDTLMKLFVIGLIIYMIVCIVLRVRYIIWRT